MAIGIVAKRTILRTIHLSALLRFSVAGVAHSVCVFFGGRQSVADEEFPSNEDIWHLKKISDHLNSHPMARR